MWDIMFSGIVTNKQRRVWFPTSVKIGNMSSSLATRLLIKYIYI